MDWRSIKFDWNRARAFLATAEEGSFSAAARALGMSQPTLGRQVEALERELGVALFERAGRGLVLTPAGRDLVHDVRAMGKAAERVSLTATGRTEVIEGTVTVTASEIYSAHLLPPIIARLRRDYPQIAIDIVASNAPMDLRRREADIAVRNFQPVHPELIARKIRDDTGQLYAAPSYLDRLGRPEKQSDLNRADFIGFDDVDGFRKALNGHAGLELTERSFPVATASHLVQWELVKQGIGIGAFPCSLGDPEPKVELALPDFPPIVYPIWLTAHRELATSRRVRLVFDVLAEMLA